MREEYKIFIRLCYDKTFLEEFLANRSSTLDVYYPKVKKKHFVSSRATTHGIEEEYYKRLSTLLKTSKEIFGDCHNLIIALFGNAFFERILLNFFNQKLKKSIFKNKQEILDPFDGYVIGPFIMKAAKKWLSKDRWWLYPLLEYKWGYYHAKRVTLGFPALFRYNNLAEGATLIETDFELRPLLREVERMENYSVSYELLRKRIVPKKGYYACIILPKDDKIIELKLNKGAIDKLNQFTKVKNINEIEDKKAIEKLSFVLSNSFLCCSNEFCDSSLIEEEISKQVRPLPH